MKNFNFIWSFLFAFISVFQTFPAIAANPIETQSSQKEFAVNGGFEQGLAGWTVYKDAASSVPVDCQGGVPSLSIATTKISPLAGKSSGVITHPASNTQGEGAAKSFSIDRATKVDPRVISVEAEYEKTSGTYDGGTSTADSDLMVYLYDKTASKIVYPNSNKIDGGGRLSATFQNDKNSTDFLVCVHSAKSTATAFGLMLDTLSINVKNKVSGSIITETRSYVPALPTGAFGTVTGVEFTYSRAGDKASVNGSFVAGTVASAAGAIPMPGTINATLMGTTPKIVGRWVRGNAATNSIKGGPLVWFPASNQVEITSDDRVATMYPTATTGANSILASAEFITVKIDQVPIAGWSGTSSLSSEAETRVVAAAYSFTTNRTVSTSSVANFDTKNVDTHNAVAIGSGAPGSAGSGWKFVVPVPGIYQVDSYMISATALTNSVVVYKNGISGERLMSGIASNQSGSGSVLVAAVVGDVIQIARDSGSYDCSYGTVSIKRLSGPSQIAASESVSARYNGTITGSPVSYGAAAYSNKIRDTHNAYNTTTGIYTVPTSGTYTITAAAGVNATYTAGHFVAIGFGVNGATQALGAVSLAAAMTGVQYPQFSGTGIPLKAGDQVYIGAGTNGASPSFGGSADVNHFSITRTGN